VRTRAVVHGAAALVLCLGSPALAFAQTQHWFVRAGAVNGEGSCERPFSRIGDALERASDGATVHVAPGLYREQLVLTRPVVLAGEPGSVLLNEASGIGLQLHAPSELVGLEVRGGEVGVEARAEARLRDVRLIGQSVSGVRALAAVHLEGCRLEATRPARLGLSAAGAAVRLTRTRFEGPFSFAVHLEGGSLAVKDIEIVGANRGVACVEGCRGRLDGSRIADLSGAGLVVGAGSQLEARDNLISGCEQCIVGNVGAVLVLEDNVTTGCALTGIASVGARLVATHHVHAGPARVAAVHVLGGTATLREGVILDPGSIGVAQRQGSLRIAGTVIRGAVSDSDGGLGDGVYSYDADELRLDTPFLEANHGTGLTVQSGQATALALGLEAHGNRLAGVLAQWKARLHATGLHASGAGAGIVVLEGSQVEIAFGRLGVLGARTSCVDGTRLMLEQVDPPAAGPCVERK